MKRWTFRIVLCLLLVVVTSVALRFARLNWKVEAIVWLLLAAGIGIAWAVIVRRAGPSGWWALLTFINVIAFSIYTVPLLFLGVFGVFGRPAYTHDYPVIGSILLAAAALGVIFHAVSVFLVVSAARRVRRLNGHCPMCKYDLRGDLDAGCPECGWNRES